MNTDADKIWLKPDNLFYIVGTDAAGKKLK